MRIVLDTNIIISAFATRGLCEAIFELCLDRPDLLISVKLIDEVDRNLRKQIKLQPVVIKQIVQLLRENGTLYKPSEINSGVIRDPNDLHILGLAVAGTADYLITGDKDLLVVEKIGSCRILSPRRFSEIVHKNRKAGIR